MSDLMGIWSQLTKFPNGEAVGKRMAQLLEISLRPDNEDLYPSVQTIWRAIESREEQFLSRTFREIRQEGSVTALFEEAMRKADHDEWENFKTSIDLDPILDDEVERIIADGSGLVRGTGFEDWVLGKTTRPIDPETIKSKVRILGKEL